MKKTKNIACNPFIEQDYNSAHTIKLRHKLKFIQICIFALDSEGYLVGFSTFTSQANIGFFDVKFKTSEVETQTIRTMKHTNVAVTNVFLNNIKQAGSPLTVNKLQPTQKGYIFLQFLEGQHLFSIPCTECQFQSFMG